MFKLIFTILVLFSTVNAKTYIGCGESEKNARDELAKSIYVSVNSSFEKNESVSGDEIQRDMKNWSKQSTNIKLINVQIETNETVVCANIKTEDLELSLNGLVAEVNSFNISNISKNHKEAKAQLLKKIRDCQSGIYLASVLDKNGTVSNLNRKMQLFQTRLETVFAQSIRFNLPNQNLKIYIDGNRERYKINEDIPLKIGEHQYTIKSKKHCDISGNFNLEVENNIIIDNIDLEDHLYPRITFTSNKDKQFIKFSVDNKNLAIGQEHIFKKCSGELIYRAEYSDGSYNDVEDGKIAISSGTVKDIHLEFLSIGDIKNLQNQTQPYKSGERLEFLYSYGYAEDNQYNKDTHNISFNLLIHKRFFRYGYGGMLGLDNFSNPDIKILELYYQVAVQFTSFGDNDLPLRIGNSFSFIPYGGVQFGVGYHEYKYGDEKIYQYPRTGDGDAKKLPADYDIFNWKRDLIVLKPIIGIDFILSKGFAIKIFAERNIFIDERWNIGTGLSVEF